MHLTTPWRRSTPLGRGVFLAAAIVATLYGGAKPTNQNNRAPRRMAQAPQPESTGIPPNTSASSSLSNDNEGQTSFLK